MIRQFAAVAALLLTSGVAYAHPGHTHVGNEVFHHSMETVLVLAAALTTLFVWNRVRNAKRQPQETQTQRGNH